MNLRCAIVRPPVDVLHKFSKPVECLGIAYVTAALRAEHHDVVMLDGMLFDWSVEQTAREILAVEPDLVGFTVVLNYFPPQISDIANLLRAGGYRGPILVGGHAPSFFPGRILAAAPEVDAVICGEGERPIVDLAQAMLAGADWSSVPGLAFRTAGGSLATTPVRRIRDVELLAHPARDLTADLVDNDGLVAMSTSRGCYARCNFCSVPRFYGLERTGPGLAAGDWLGRPAVSMASEMLALHESFGLLEALIVDDEFFGGRHSGYDRAAEFGALMEASGAPVGFALSCRAENVSAGVLEQLAKGGLRHVFVGLESGVDSDLRFYGKGHSAEQNRMAVETIKSLGLSFQAGYMLFHHRSTLAEVKRNLDYLRSIGEFKPLTINSAAQPHFGAPLTKRISHDGMLIDEGVLLRARMADPAVELSKRVAELTSNAFQPYLDTIAALQSAVTYEWHREVPGRQRADALLIDKFEQRANELFGGVVEHVVDELLTAALPPPAHEVLAMAQKRLDEVGEELDLARALLLLRLADHEPALKYWSQRDLMTKGATGAAAPECTCEA